MLTVGRYNAELWYTCPEADARATVIPARISGHKSNQMLDRLDKDVLAKKPDWMTLSCGVNDVWHGTNGVPVDAYQKNITTIVDRAQSTGIRVMILTATMIRENASMLICQTISQTILERASTLRPLSSTERGFDRIRGEVVSLRNARVGSDLIVSVDDQVGIGDERERRFERAAAAANSRSSSSCWSRSRSMPGW